jgi:hypothetical protein
MLSSLMIARCPLRLLALVAALAGVAAACERIPLLAPSGSTITLTTTATSLPVNGSVQIAAQVLEPAGTPPHTGTHLSFLTSLGTIEPSEVETDINGRATVTFNAGGVSGTATISASSGGASTGTAGAIKIAIGAAAVGRIAVSANPGTVPASGGTSTITASVQDSSGNPLGAVPVSFSTDAGALSSALVTTDSSGNAATTLNTNKTAHVTATAGVNSTTTTPPTTGTGGTTTPAPTTTTATSQTVTINVNVASTIAIGSQSPDKPTVGQPVTFPITYTQNANGSPAARMTVDFGDGSAPQIFQGAPASVSHVYNQSGTFTVTVSVVDTFGDLVSASKSVTVTPRPQITVALTTSGSLTVGGVVSFGITATPTTDAAITSVTIDFGDGTSTTLQGNATSVQHVYNAASTYTVTATAADSSGNRGSGSTVIVIGSGGGSSSGTASFTASPTSGAHPLTVNVDASSSTAQGTFQWNFGDSGSSTNTASGATASHTYNSAGSFTITLTVGDGSGQKTAQKVITVN